jgi:hypothetical protein
MEDLLQHPWVMEQGALPSIERIPIRTPCTFLDPNVVLQMEDLGFSPKDASDAVLRDAHDQISTTYYLLAHNSIPCEKSKEAPFQNGNFHLEMHEVPNESETMDSQQSQCIVC